MPECQGCGQGKETIVVEVGSALVALCLECTTRLSALIAEAIDDNLAPLHDDPEETEGDTP